MRSTLKTDEVMTALLIATGAVLPFDYTLFCVGRTGRNWLTTRVL